eukprot:scaffold626222_cov45-Prasinocladus_malaysianus.AAC.1
MSSLEFFLGISLGVGVTLVFFASVVTVVVVNHTANDKLSPSGRQRSAAQHGNDDASIFESFMQKMLECVDLVLLNLKSPTKLRPDLLPPQKTRPTHSRASFD